MSVPSNVIDKELYIRARETVKRRVKVWPSAYASGQLVTEYKRLGGRYSGSRAASKEPLDRWYREEWVNVCKRGSTGGYAKCGRSASSKREYPYCRPLRRISKATPMTVGELREKWGSRKIAELCARKRREALPKAGRAQRILPKETTRKIKK